MEWPPTLVLRVVCRHDTNQEAVGEKPEEVSQSSGWNGKRVVRGYIVHKLDQVEGGVCARKDDNFAAMIEAVSLMKWQLKGELFREEVEHVAGSDLL
jgi:hypothetical protein